MNSIVSCNTNICWINDETFKFKFKDFSDKCFYIWNVCLCEWCLLWHESCYCWKLWSCVSQWLETCFYLEASWQEEEVVKHPLSVSSTLTLHYRCCYTWNWVMLSRKGKPWQDTDKTVHCQLHSNLVNIVTCSEVLMDLEGVYPFIKPLSLLACNRGIVNGLNTGSDGFMMSQAAELMSEPNHVTIMFQHNRKNVSCLPISLHCVLCSVGSCDNKWYRQPNNGLGYKPYTLIISI